MNAVPDRARPLFDRFVAGPSAVRAAIDGIDPGSLNRVPAGESWSVRDIILHLSDGELVNAVRFRFVLAEDRPHLPPYDENLWKLRLNYLFRDPEAALALFEQARFSSAEILGRCAQEAWVRTGIHPERGEVSLESLVMSAAEHVEAHVAQIQRARAAGR